jgi:hypothetical protein
MFVSKCLWFLIKNKLESDKYLDIEEVKHKHGISWFVKRIFVGTNLSRYFRKEAKRKLQFYKNIGRCSFFSQQIRQTKSSEAHVTLNNSILQGEKTKKIQKIKPSDSKERQSVAFQSFHFPWKACARTRTSQITRGEGVGTGGGRV